MPPGSSSLPWPRRGRACSPGESRRKEPVTPTAIPMPRGRTSGRYQQPGDTAHGAANGNLERGDRGRPAAQRLRAAGRHSPRQQRSPCTATPTRTSAASRTFLVVSRVAQQAAKWGRGDSAPHTCERWKPSRLGLTIASVIRSRPAQLRRPPSAALAASPAPGVQPIAADFRLRGMATGPGESPAAAVVVLGPRDLECPQAFLRGASSLPSVEDGDSRAVPGRLREWVWTVQATLAGHLLPMGMNVSRPAKDSYSSSMPVRLRHSSLVASRVASSCWRSRRRSSAP